MTFLLRCTRCGRVEEESALRFRCDCGGALDIEFEPEFHPERTAGQPRDLSRWREVLPLRQEPVSLGEGGTPLMPVAMDGRNLLVKQEQLSPTGSYKDRGAAVLMAHLHELGVRHVVEDSSGNAGAAIAAYAARAGISCDIYVPEETAPAKTAQIEAYGAMLHRVPGTREDTAAAVMLAAETSVYASHVYNPWFLHGTKTFAYEVAEELGWMSPSVLVLPVGNGTLLLGAALGFTELVRLGVVSRMPRIIGVQAAACAPLFGAFQRGAAEPVQVVARPTKAEGIAIAEPARGAQILAAVRASGGSFLSVEEDDIAASLRDCCRMGWFIEPTAAAVVAGARRYAATAPSGEVIVTAFTGHGLKAPSVVAGMAIHACKGGPVGCHVHCGVLEL